MRSGPETRSGAGASMPAAARPAGRRVGAVRIWTEAPDVDSS